MREFADISAFLAFGATMRVEAVLAVHEGVKRGAEMIQREAKREIGHDEMDAAGQFAAWDALADATKDEKTRLGYVGQVSEYDSLLRTGALRASIDMRAHENEAQIGSNDPVAIWQELGTHRRQGMAGDQSGSIPPRSFLGGAAVRMEERVVDAISGRFVWALRGLPTRRND